MVEQISFSPKVKRSLIISNMSIYAGHAANTLQKLWQLFTGAIAPHRQTYHGRPRSPKPLTNAPNKAPARHNSDGENEPGCLHPKEKPKGYLFDNYHSSHA